MCGPQHNYRLYRQVEHDPPTPFLPCIAIHLRDMLFTNEATPSKINGLYKCVGRRRACVRR